MLTLNEGMRELKPGDRCWHDSIFGISHFTVLEAEVVPWSGYVDLRYDKVPGATRTGFHFCDAGLNQQAIKVRYDKPGVGGKDTDTICTRDFRGLDRFSSNFSSMTV